MFQKTSSFPLATVQLYRKIGNGSSFVDKFLCVLPKTALVLRKSGEESNQKLKNLQISPLLLWKEEVL